MLGTTTTKRIVRALILLPAALCLNSAFAQVGLRTIHAGAMPITLVYPTDVQATTQKLGPFRLQAALGAPVAHTNGRLIVLSHGTGGDALGLFTLSSTLAQAGFVVATPEHQGDNWHDHSQLGPPSWQHRPAEVLQTIDTVAHDPAFAALLHTNKVGVYGMSAGGLTALALAGGQWSVANIVRHCFAHGVADPGFCFYQARNAQEVQSLKAAYAQPPSAAAEQLFGGAQAHDARIAAVAVSVPAAANFTPESLASIAIPVGIVEAGDDPVLNPAFHSSYVLAHCPRCQRLDKVDGGTHFDTLSPWPDAVAKLMAADPKARRNPMVTDARRQVSYNAISAFMQKELAPLEATAAKP